jgi:hypothetical protein
MSLRSLGVSVAKSARTFQVYTTFGWVTLLVFAVAAIGAALSRQPGEALRGLAEVIKVAAWPTVVAVLLLAFRDQIAAQFPRITKLSSSVLSIEISIEQQLSEAKQDAVGRGVAAEQVSVSDVERASAVDMLVTQADLPQIRARFEALADEYESIRSSMPSSDDRTRAMGVITAQMGAPLVEPHIRYDGNLHSADHRDVVSQPSLCCRFSPIWICLNG